MRARVGDAESLLQLAAERDLVLCLPPGTITRVGYARQAPSTLDLVFASEDLASSVIKCYADGGHGSNHREVNTVLDLQIRRAETEERLNWRQTDWEKFAQVAEDSLTALGSQGSLTSREALDGMVQKVVESLATAAAETVPVAKPSPFSKRWWTSELSEMRCNLKHLQNQAAKPRASPSVRKAARELARDREYHSAIRQQQRRHWKEWLENATEQTVWQANRYASSLPENSQPSHTPDLSTPGGGTASTNADKCSAFIHQFFPDPPPADLHDTLNFTYPESLPNVDITDAEVRTGIENLSPYKAPGLSGIRNIALLKCKGALVPLLTKIFNASLRLQYFPEYWRKFVTIFLRKPGKPDYTILKAYRPIALGDTIGKIAESVIASRLSSLAEQHALLPDTHFGGRPGRTTTDAVLYGLQRIKDAARKGQVTSVLFLDISQAFPSVSHARLLHNLRKRAVPDAIVNWIASFLTDRTTTLKFDDYTSELRHASVGVPQGSPLVTHPLSLLLGRPARDP